METFRAAAVDVPVESLRVRAFRIPTDAPESDGTFEWDATTMVVVELDAGGKSGIGYSYANVATAQLVHEHLAHVVCGIDALDIPAAWTAMVGAIRNIGRPGVASMAIAAVDTAMWDLKAKLFDTPLCRMLGRTSPQVKAYGSGGFTSYDDKRLSKQLASWIEAGAGAVKMKIGREPSRDVDRVRTARAAIGDGPELYVDANGAYRAKQALAFARQFTEQNVTWFEEPVSSDDLDGLRMLRDRVPAPMRIAAGEYGYDTPYFRRMLEGGAVDVLQADATRCAGFTGFLQAAPLADAFMVPVSAHCAPALHVHPCCSAPNVLNIEYFHDHARIEQMLFDGSPVLTNGVLRPDLTRPGIGLQLRETEAAPFLVWHDETEAGHI